MRVRAYEASSHQGESVDTILWFFCIFLLFFYHENKVLMLNDILKIDFQKIMLDTQKQEQFEFLDSNERQ